MTLIKRLATETPSSRRKEADHVYTSYRYGEKYMVPEEFINLPKFKEQIEKLRQMVENHSRETIESE